MHIPPRLAAIAAACLVLVACSGDPEPEPTPTPTPTVTPTPTPTPPPVVGARAPLTGMEMAEEDDLLRPVLAVKVENSPAARPQSGLEQADIVFEELVEGGITRFIALFHSRVPEAIGPIRSARLVDVDILPPYGGALAISGARDQVLGALASAGVPFMADGTGFYRESTRRAPHNLYASGENLWGRVGKIDGPAPAATSWQFDEDVPAGFVDCDGDPVCEDASLEIAFSMSRQSTTAWSYDEDEGVYRRLQNGKPFLVTGEGSIGAANVVILEMKVGDGECCDSNGSPLVHTTVVGNGRAVILRDGNWYEARWVKPSRSQELVFTTLDGEAFQLKPGPTWVHLAPRANVPEAP